MDTDRYRRIDHLFDAVLERPEAERGALLDRIARTDPEVRRVLDELLLAEVDSRSLDATDAGEPIRVAGLEALDHYSQASDALPTFGPYRAVERVGRGGMGDVFLAERDGDYQRRVAVKVIRHGLAEAAGLHERFHRERQILARLEHPNIAALYDGGTTDDGRPWLAMEWIDGQPIDAYCDAHRLDVGSRLGLFLQLCDAVEQAHRHLLVHRDLKPANILVTEGRDGRGATVKLLDFGIAKPLANARESALATRTGQRPMSPAWASPEQVLGDEVTTASDVYGLGVLLYELLAGASPYRLESELPHELEAAILQQLPRRPSTVAGHAEARSTTRLALRRRLAGDLDAIVLRAIEKDPSRRYGAVAELAADIRRHLADEPVLARRAAHRVDGFLYRTGKLLRRHHLASIATVVVVVVLAGALAVVSRQAQRLTEQRDRAERTLGAITGFFEDGLRIHGGGEVQLAELLSTAADGTRRELAEEPVVRARLLGVLAGMSHQLGRLGQAASLSNEGLAVARDAGLDPSHEIEHLYRLGVAHHGRGDMHRAGARFSEALARIGERPSPLEPQIYSEMAQVRWKLGDRMARDHLARRALELLDDPRYRRGADAVQLANLRGDLSALIRDREAAIVAYRQAYRLRRQQFGDAHPATAWSRCKLGAMLQATGRPAAAGSHLEPAIEILRAVGDDRLQSEACNHLTLAQALFTWRDLPGAEAAYWHHLDSLIERFGLASRPAAFAQLALAATIMMQDDLDTAEALLMDGLDLVRELDGDASIDAGRYLCMLGELAMLRDQTANAEEYFVRCGERFPEDRVFGRLWVDVGLGRVAASRGDAATAVDRLGRAYEVTVEWSRRPSTSVEIAEIGVEYGDALAAVGRSAEAIEVFQTARRIYQNPEAHCEGRALADEITERLDRLEKRPQN